VKMNYNGDVTNIVVCTETIFQSTFIMDLSGIYCQQFSYQTLHVQAFDTNC
jgi:hypothetical protein